MTDMIRPAAFAVAAFAAAACTAVSAAELIEMKPAKSGTVVTLPVTAQVELANDEATVSFYTMETDKDLAAATRRVIERVNAGLSKLKTLDLPVEYKTQSLTSYPRYNTPAKPGEQPKIIGWEVRQSVTAHVKDVDAAAKVAQEAAERFAFNGVQFSLSREAQQKVQAELMKTAVEQVRLQAQAVAESMGLAGSTVRVESLDFHDAGYVRPMMMSRSAAQAESANAKRSMPMPVFEAGKSTVSRHVNARVRIGG